jgi:hypothetical protein
MTESSTQWPDPYQPPAQSSTPPAPQPPPPTYPAYQTPPNPYVATGYPGAPYAVSRPTNGLALASMILSLVGLVTCLAIPVSTVGAILGHVGLKQIRESGQDGETYAKVGIIIGWIATGLVVVGGLGAFLWVFLIAASA